MVKLKLNIIKGLAESLPVDNSMVNRPQQVSNIAASLVNPTKPSDPKLLHASTEVAQLLGIGDDLIKENDFLKIFSGSEIYEGTKPYAMNYGGHQFGHWAGQLGDGRAINLFDVENQGQRWTLQLKGAGPTPYSRTADGFAVLRSSIREYLCSEAMYHLGVPTTRALSLIKTGDQVLRDVMYDGHPDYEPGAIVCRVAPSFIRFGNFEIHTRRSEFDVLQKHTDFTIENYFPENNLEGKEKYIAFFKEVSERTMKLMLEWHRVGFVHGVMNTDNMSILGLTIDFGPYGWVDDYNYGWTPNTTDRAHKRYRFGNQANIALWNLVQLANALYLLVEDVTPFEEIFATYQKEYRPAFLKMMTQKLGLMYVKETDDSLITALEKLMHEQELDMTIFFRNLSNFQKAHLTDHEDSKINVIKDAFYFDHDLLGESKEKWINWINQYLKRLNEDDLSDDERKVAMNSVNPKYVLRNYIAQMIIEAAEKEDYGPLNEVYNLLRKPYDEQLDLEKWFAKRPDWARNKVGASMLSCSS